MKVSHGNDSATGDIFSRGTLELTFKVLRLCNSSYYGLPRKINSIQEALVYIGTDTLVNFVLAGCLSTSRRDSSRVSVDLAPGGVAVLEVEAWGETPATLAIANEGPGPVAIRILDEDGAVVAHGTFRGLDHRLDVELTATGDEGATVAVRVDGAEGARIQADLSRAQPANP